MGAPYQLSQLMVRFTLVQGFNMAALTGQPFIDNLNRFLTKANLSGQAKAWYSFWPKPGQSNFEFVFNDLLPTGQSFLQKVGSVIIAVPGVGYGDMEVPNVTFTSNDAGEFASGTAVMSSTATNSINLIGNSDFSQGASGWYTYEIDSFLTQPPFQADAGSFKYIFESGGVHFRNRGDNDIYTGAVLVPNSGRYFSGANPYWVIGQLDVKAVNIGVSQPLLVGLIQSGNPDASYLQLQTVDLGGLGIFAQTGTKQFAFYVTGNYPVAPALVFRTDEFPDSDEILVDNFIVWTGVSAEVSTILNGLTHSWPVTGTGVNAINNGGFSNSNFWMLNSGGLHAAGDSGLLYKFESGMLHFFRTNPSISIDEGNFIASLIPNSGTGINFSTSGWLYGSITVVSPSSQGALFINGLGDGNMSHTQIDISTTGVKYFGAYLPASGTVFPILEWDDSVPSNDVVLDNFTLVLSNLGQDVISNNAAISFYSTTNDYGEGFGVCEGKHGVGFYTNEQFGTATRSSLVVNFPFPPSTFGEHNTVALWHKLTPDSNFDVNNTVLAVWQNISLEIINGKYGVRSMNNSVIQSNAVISTGDWRLLTISMDRLDNGTHVVSLGVDANISSGSAGLNFGVNAAPVMTIYGSDIGTLYQVAVDEISYWDRTLIPGEISELYNNGSGEFYPFGSSVQASRSVIGVTITSPGDSYIVSPTIVIDPPSGGGTAAQAVAILASDSGRLYADSLPGLAVGGTNFIVTGMASGTGNLISGNNDFLRVGNNLKFDDWTLFMNFSPTAHYSGRLNVLVSTMDYVNQQSGFILGVNDSNRLFIEFMDNTHPSGSVRRQYTHDEEIGRNNLISFSKDDTHKTFTICVHDLADHDTRSKSYSLQGFSDATTLYLGGFPNSGLVSNHTGYTGMMGYLFDCLLISGAANAVQCDALSETFFTSGYQPSGLIPVVITYPVVTGAVFTTGIFTTGVTGTGFGVVSIPDKDGTAIVIYDSQQFTGAISGTGIVYLSGTTSGTRTVYSGTPEVFYYDNNYIKRYAEQNIVFLDYSVVSSDMVQIYSFGDKQIDKISVIPAPFSLNDFYFLNTFNVNNIPLVFNDGILQVTGIDYSVASGKIISSGLSAYHSTYNFLLYDEISGNSTTISGWSGWVGQKTIITTGILSGLIYSGAQDVYINGQKLVSGYDYIPNTSGFTLTGTQNSQTVTWASGVFAFPPTRTGLRSIFTGAGLGYYSNISGTLGTLMDEMVWLNGQRLAPDFDYKKVSSLSLLLATTRPSGLSYQMYTGDPVFPLSILTGKPNI
jgi:hypothetical protein